MESQAHPAPSAPAAAAPPNGSWERETLEKLVFATVREQQPRPLGHLLQAQLPAAGLLRPVVAVRLRLFRHRRRAGWQTHGFD
ncbi:hypothetical protein LP419_28400 [Massilia sp. H-1]|nr:hypothetical protein LP419_28400 [Massilia sp. H-1]